LEEPQYTRPADFRGWVVPDVLRGGDHARIERWRLAQALHRTLLARPDLISARGGLQANEARLLEEFPSVAYPSSITFGGHEPAPSSNGIAP
jgi:tRNA (guanine37-N1)-methyltransferase